MRTQSLRTHILRNWKSLPVALFFAFPLPVAHAQERVVVEGQIPSAGPEETPPRPFAPTIIGQEQLKMSSGQTLGEVLQSQAGIEVASAGGPGQLTSVYIRGANADQVLVLIDGIRVNNAINPSASFDFSDLSVTNIERVEIYKGSESVSFGPDAIGGVINIISKSGAGGVSGTGLVEIGSYVTQIEAAEVSGALSQFSYALGGSYFQTQGFSAADTQLGNVERDGSSLAALSAHLGWNMLKAGELNFYLRSNDDLVALDTSGGPNGDDPNYNSKFHQTVFGLSWKNHPVSSNLHSEILLGSTQVQSSDQNLPDPRNPASSADHFYSNTFSLDSRNKLAITESLGINIDLGYRRDQGSSHSVAGVTQTNFPKAAAENWGEAVSFLWDKDLWQSQIGLRHDEFNAQFQAWNYSASLKRSSSDKKNEVSAKIFTGLKTPSLYQLYSNFGDPSLHSENVDGWELKAQHQSANASTLTASYFDSSFVNLIDFDPISEKYQNIASSRIHGFELEDHWPVADSLLSLHPYWTHLLTRDNSTGLDLLRRSRDQMGFNLNSDLGNVQASIQYTRIGSRDDLDPVTFARVSLPGYDIWSLNSMIQVDRDYKLKLKLINILNRHYEEVDGYGTSGAALYAGLQGSFH